MSRCDLYLENYVDHYTGGETIIGHVAVTFNSEKEVHGISVSIKGEAKTHWSETESHYNHTTKRNESRSVSYYGSHVFIANEIELLGGTRTIAPGAYKYPFRYTLPDNLQSTFKGSVGKIEYKIKAVVKRPMLRFNYEAESPIVIVTPVNLNFNPSLRNAVSRTRTKTTYFCCWSKGDITVEVNIPQTGVAIGERLPLLISVQNLSQSNIEQVKTKVKKRTKYTVTSPQHSTRHDSATIFSDHYTGVGANGENTYDKVVLVDNVSSIPNFINCDVIEVSYELEITFVLSGMHKNVEIEIPITVGHIALGAVAPPRGVMPVHTVQPIPVPGTAPPSYGFVNPSLQPAYNPDVMPGIPMPVPVPPSYNEAASFGGYPSGPSAPSAPSAPFAAGAEATAPTKRNQDDWEMIDDSENKDLPTYDQATSYPMKS